MPNKVGQFFASRFGIIIVGSLIGILALLLQIAGNPKNMGVCVACFQRDIAGALGLHRAAVVQYIRPEIIGFVFGSFISALLFKEFKSRTGSAPLVRFFLGIFAMIGALAFLGCPWRAILRLAGGDLNALIGLAGLSTGIYIGIQFLTCGFTLGRTQKTYPLVGLLMPLFMGGLLILLVTAPKFIYFSAKGPGAQHAPLLFSLLAGLGIGFLAQRSRFCTMGAIRDVILIKDIHLLSGVLAMLVAAFCMNLLFGLTRFSFSAQPIAHSSHLWNFLGMVLSGLCFSLAGGCPGRQLFLAGEGNSDSAIFAFGMIFGAAFAHNFSLAGKPDSMINGTLDIGGLSQAGMTAVLIGIVFCLSIGLFMRERI